MMIRIVNNWYSLLGYECYLCNCHSVGRLKKVYLPNSNINLNPISFIMGKYKSFNVCLSCTNDSDTSGIYRSVKLKKFSNDSIKDKIGFIR